MTICGPNESLTRDQVAQFMRNAGFPEATIPVGLAVAMGESGLQSGNCNLSDPYGGSFGLWQINGSHFQSGAVTQSCAFDPQCATNFAFQLWSSQGWNPWGAYTNGSYRNYLNGSSGGDTSLSFPAQTTQCQCPSGYTAQNLGTLTQPYWACVPSSGDVTKAVHCTNDSQVNDPLGLGTFTKFFSDIAPLTEWLKSPVRIIKMVVGLLLVGSAIFLIASPESQIARTVMKTAGKVGVS